MKRGFASDNNAGVHPAIMEAMGEANEGHVIAYGDDPVCQRSIAKMKEVLGGKCEIFYVFTGTAANVLGLEALSFSHNAIICTETAHIHVDECGAPEKYTGSKLLIVPTDNGKLTVEGVKKHMHGIGFEHHVQPRIISITQATEMGTLYSVEEIRELADYAHENNMYLHMDGARLANAATGLGTGFYEITGGAGVDVLSFGGTKNGMMYGEAVVFFRTELAENFKYTRKQGMQLSSKMRYVGAQFEAYLENELWKENASHANQMAKKLYLAVKDIPGVKITQEVQANGVFAIIPAEVIPALQKDYFFYMWDEERSEVRWMCSFDTTIEDVEGFAARLEELMKP